MGFWKRVFRPARRAIRGISREHQGFRRAVSKSWSKGKGKYKSKIKEKWSSKFKGKGATKEELNQFIETISNELANEISVDITKESPERISDPTGEMREVVKAETRREVTKLIDKEAIIREGLYWWRTTGREMTDPQPDSP